MEFVDQLNNHQLINEERPLTMKLGERKVAYFMDWNFDGWLIEYFPSENGLDCENVGEL
jgi:hypothetical protein